MFRLPELDHLIELSCGAAVAPAFQPTILADSTRRRGVDKPNIVIAMRGGSRINRETVDGFCVGYELGSGRNTVNGQMLQKYSTALTLSCVTNPQETPGLGHRRPKQSRGRSRAPARVACPYLSLHERAGVGDHVHF